MSVIKSLGSQIYKWQQCDWSVYEGQHHTWCPKIIAQLKQITDLIEEEDKRIQEARTKKLGHGLLSSFNLNHPNYSLLLRGIVELYSH